MLLSHLKRLCITSASLIASSPLNAAPTVASSTSSLPDALQKNVPLCAQSCLQASLAERYPVACTVQQGIECLCSRYSNMGESLGEVALSCIYSSCSAMDRSAASAYNICLGQKDAVMPTKTALTVVASSAPRTTSTFSSKSVSTITSIAMSTLRTQERPTQSIFVDSISILPSATSSVSSTPAPATIKTEAPTRMSPAQIAGLSVAAVAAFIFAVGLMALSVCLRRRKERKFVLDSDEKGVGQRQKKQSARFSHYVPVERPPEPPKQFPLVPQPVLRKGGKYPPPKGSRAVQRLGVGTSNSASDSSLPLDQIGLAISAELDGKSAAPKTSARAVGEHHQPAVNQSQLDASFRPVSTLTQNTVFEEDDISAHRRSSVLLPTPPVAVPPIRGLQPSRPASVGHTNARQAARRSELFLNIPIRHERPQPRRVIAAEMPSNGSPKPLQPPSRLRLAPAIQMTPSSSFESKSTTASSRKPGNNGDILDYYLSAHARPTPRASPARKESPKNVQVRSKKSLSTVSLTTSRASTNNRDSLSSQTSFETADVNDPTPDDEDDDKQLSDDNVQQLSPVAESPISNLRYPKVPRSSNQLVPRSPRSPLHHKSPSQSQKSTRRPPEHATILQKRHHDLPPPLLETRRRLNSPHRDPFTNPPRKARAHVRSVSTDSWSATPASKVDRKSRVQSGVWTKSPMMYEAAVVKPLNVRRRRDEMMEVNVGRDVDVDAEGLKSPVWVPRLTPTRKGDDLFISVGWGGGGR